MGLKQPAEQTPEEARSNTRKQRIVRDDQDRYQTSRSANQKRVRWWHRIPNPFAFTWRFLKSLFSRVRGNRKGWLVLAQFAAVFGLIAGGWWLAQHGLGWNVGQRWFALQKIDVSGAQHLNKSEIIAMTNLQRGTSLFNLDVSAIQTTLQTHPWIARANVSRRPLHTLRINIQEREPRALVLVDGHLWLVSDEFEAFKVVEDDDPIDLPIITGIDGSRFATEPEYRKSALLDALALLADYRSSGLPHYDNISDIQVDSSGDQSLVLAESGTWVRLGRAPYRQKLRRLARVLAKAQRENWALQTVRMDNRRDPGRVAVLMTSNKNEAVPTP